jgi:AraC-like DNA-binding protein
MTWDERARRLALDGVVRFVRETQVSVGIFVPPVDPVTALSVVWRLLASRPPMHPSGERYVLDVLVALAERLSRLETELGASAPPEGSPVAAVLMRGVVLRFRHGDLRCADLASLARCSPRRAGALIREATGFRLTTHIKGLRSMAALITIQRGATVGAAAAAVGYRHSSELSRAFRHWFGISPRTSRTIGGSCTESLRYMSQ